MGAASVLCCGVLTLLSTAPLLGRGAETRLGDLRGGTGSTGGRRSGPSVHLVALVSLSFVLGVMAYLILLSARNLREHEMGFEAAGVQVVEVTFPQWKLPLAEQRRALADELAARLNALPGTSVSAWASDAPPHSGLFMGPVGAGSAGRSLPADLLSFDWVGPGYFRTLRLPLAAGRGFLPEDRGAEQAVVVVSAALARAMEASPEQLLNTHIEVAGEKRRVVGVAADLDVPGLMQALEGKRLYLPFEDVSTQAALLVRTESPVAGEARRAVAALDPDLGIRVAPLVEHLSDTASGLRLMVGILTVGSSLALLLTLAALYGALARFVASHRQDVGLRMVLGANRGDIARWVGSRALRVFAAGAVLGWLGSYPLGRLVAEQLFEVPPRTRCRLASPPRSSSPPPPWPPPGSRRSGPAGCSPPRYCATPEAVRRPRQGASTRGRQRLVFFLRQAPRLEGAAPRLHRRQDGREGTPQLRHLVFHPGRYLRVDVPRDHAVRLQLPQLEGDHALRGVRGEPPQLAEAFSTLQQVADEDRFPPPTDHA